MLWRPTISIFLLSERRRRFRLMLSSIFAAASTVEKWFLGFLRSWDRVRQRRRRRRCSYKVRQSHISRKIWPRITAFYAGVHTDLLYIHSPGGRSFCKKNTYCCTVVGRILQCWSNLNEYCLKMVVDQNIHNYQEMYNFYPKIQNSLFYWILHCGQ